MDYYEKISQQHPFIYIINHEYYAIGRGVCSKVPDGFVLLEKEYKGYLQACKSKCEQQDAWTIFHKLKNIAEFVKDSSDSKCKSIEELRNLKLKAKEEKSLFEQVEQYRDFFQKYNLKDYLP